MRRLTMQMRIAETNNAHRFTLQANEVLLSGNECTIEILQRTA